MTANINDLIDDILLSVLSLLPPKDAARTSLVCRRWQYLHRRCPSLAFDKRDIKGNEKLCRTKEFLNIVSSILLFHTGESLEQFKLVFDSRDGWDCKRYVDSFLRTARSKNVRSLFLELLYVNSTDLHDYKGNGLYDDNWWYCLPSYIFKCASLRRMVLKYCTIGTIGRPSLQSLAVLHLIFVKGSEQSIQELITSCISLKELAVEGCHLIKSLQISLLKLETLSVRCCHRMKSLRINAPNLFSLNFQGDLFNKLDFKFLRPEELRCVILGLCNKKEYSDNFKLLEPPCSLTRAKEFTKFAMELQNAEDLSLVTSSLEDFSIEELRQFALQLHKVKHLSLKGWVGSRRAILGVTILLALTPSIEFLNLEFTEKTTNKDPTATDEELTDFPSIDCLNHTLKRMTLRNFVGNEAELILLELFFEHAVFLDEICIRWGKEKRVNFSYINILKKSKSTKIRHECGS